MFVNNSSFFVIFFNRGAALPTNTPGIPCIFDPHGRAGICGDWLLGLNIEDAVLSGVSLAHHVRIKLVLTGFKFDVYLRRNEEDLNEVTVVGLGSM